jgi:PDZ domain-containing secreted protein
MEVTVSYQESDGVLVATHIAQRWYTQTGYIKATTPGNREIVMERMGMAKKFKVNDNTRLTIHDETAKLSDLKPGQKVTVTYTKQDDVWLAQKVEDTSETFTGAVEAIDAGSNSIKVKSLINTRKFNLGEGCKIVLNGETNGKLKDLRIGQKVTIDYEEVKGVMVAARIELDAAHTVASTRNAVVQQSQ